MDEIITTNLKLYTNKLFRKNSFKEPEKPTVDPDYQKLISYYKKIDTPASHLKVYERGRKKEAEKQKIKTVHPLIKAGSCWETFGIRLHSTGKLCNTDSVAIKYEN